MQCFSTVSGRFTVTQAGREALLEEGDFTIRDTAEPFTLPHHTPCEAVVLRVPEKLMRRYIAVPEELAGRVVSARQGFGAVASSTIRALGLQVRGGLDAPKDSGLAGAGGDRQLRLQVRYAPSSHG
jgi:hypothetical protein